MTGDRSAHPLLISLANIKMDYRAKGSHHAYLLLALLPIPKFIEKNRELRGVLEARLVHQCLDFVLDPLKEAARVGVMLNDPRGFSRYCFTPLAAYIADTPEAAMLSGVAGKNSHLTMATHKQLGDSYPQEPRTTSSMLAKLHAIAAQVDPVANIRDYIKQAKAKGLSGVHQPFWRNWAQAELSRFFPPEMLHHWHKMSWDHDLKWCINALGRDEIDFRFSILQPHTGFRQFNEGISSLKQVTGRDHRNLQRYIVGVIAGAPSNEFVIAIRALIEFRYLGQAPIISDDVRTRIRNALQEFHHYKQAILDANARVGKGNKPINNWYIPKLEMMQSVYGNIQLNGVPCQWSAEFTERAHIDVIKQPARSGNNRKHEEQICRTLDRISKAQRFDLATTIREIEIRVEQRLWDDAEGDSDAEDVDDIPDSDFGLDLEDAIDDNPPSSLGDHIVSPCSRQPRSRTNYFQVGELLAQQQSTTTPFPLRTWSIASTAFHLTRKPPLKMSLDDAATRFGLPDLIPSLSHFLHRLESGDSLLSIGGRRHASSSLRPLPYREVQVWTSVILQLKEYHRPHIVLPPNRLNAHPPTKDWPLGRYDIAFANTDAEKQWPRCGLSGKSSYLDILGTQLKMHLLTGHSVVQIRIIFHLLPPLGADRSPASSMFLAYVQRFETVPQNLNLTTPSPRGAYPDPVTRMYFLKRSLRADGSRMGDVIPVANLRAPADIIARFQKKADTRLTKESCLEYSQEFILNKFFTPELFFSLEQLTV